MRSDIGRAAKNRGAVPVHLDDNAPHTDRVSERGIKVLARFRRRPIAHASGRHGFTAQARFRAAGFGSIAAENSKTPTSKSQGRSKLQTARILFEIWELIIDWGLVLGI